jgi:hypothetical protein
MGIREITLEEAQMFWEIHVPMLVAFMDRDGRLGGWNAKERDPTFSPKQDFEQFGTRPHLLYHWGVEVDE